MILYHTWHITPISLLFVTTYKVRETTAFRFDINMAIRVNYNIKQV